MKLTIIFTMAALSTSVICCMVTPRDEVPLSSTAQRKLSPKLLAEKLSMLRIPGEGKGDEVYEIDDDGILTGPDNTTTDLKMEARPISFSPAMSDFTYSLNGEVRLASQVDAVVHQAGDYHIMYDDDGRVSLVWGDNLFLQRVDPVNLPGVFLNMQKKKLSIADVSGKPGFYKMRAEAEHFAMTETSRQGGNCRMVKVAVAFDNMLCSRLENSPEKAATYVRAVVSYASSILKRDTCHELSLVNIDGHCEDENDPYSFQSDLMKIAPSGRSSYLLNRFGTFYNENRRDVERDVAYFFSGFFDGTGVAGAAYVGAACTVAGYGWAELGFRPIFTHEIGHSLGSDHTTTGIMRPMYYSGMPVKFSRASKKQINTFLRTERASCIGMVR